jgi:hypothetical protein
VNTKIYNFLLQNLNESFKLAKYVGLTIDDHTVINELPWTPAKLAKFKKSVSNTLGFEPRMFGTIKEEVSYLDDCYLNKFFGTVWKSHTLDYKYTGKMLAANVNVHEPRSVLDVGCGYNEFKSQIPNLTGIDPYNESADYMVDILDFTSGTTFDAIIALGSINFGTFEDIDEKFAKCVSLLASDGRFYLRVNPGRQHASGPWVEIFKWTFEVADHLAQKYNLKLESYKTDLDRVYIVYSRAT